MISKLVFMFYLYTRFISISLGTKTNADTIMDNSYRTL